MSVIGAIFMLYLAYRIIFVDKEDKRGFKCWWEYDPEKWRDTNEKGRK